MKGQAPEVLQTFICLRYVCTYLARECGGHGTGGERILSLEISGTLPLRLTPLTLAVTDNTVQGAVKSAFLSTLRPRLLGNPLILQLPYAAQELVL